MKKENRKEIKDCIKKLTKIFHRLYSVYEEERSICDKGKKFLRTEEDILEYLEAYSLTLEETIEGLKEEVIGEADEPRRY